ncbi:DUF6452 family protein [Maribacter chungangensis]|uniref:DUF6452 family protein n=1 Tax=Maribacter chungangensis TaxID=1069117 RepID=A0ABW3B6T7_9FLAO
MKNFGYSILLLILLFTVASCEKDDICVEGTTPLMVVEFFDVNNRNTPKNVAALRVVGEGQLVTVNTVADRTALNKINIPLKTVEESTSFLLISNSADNDDGFETGNIDTLVFDYARLEDFKSRACGFIVNYQALEGTLTTDTDNWIQEIEIIRSDIINSDSTHVKIYH